MTPFEVTLILIVIGLVALVFLFLAAYWVSKDPHYEVHCGQCRWWGLKRSLSPEFGCPMCLSDQWLEYKEEQ